MKIDLSTLRPPTGIEKSPPAPLAADADYPSVGLVVVLILAAIIIVGLIVRYWPRKVPKPLELLRAEEARLKGRDGTLADDWRDLDRLLRKTLERQFGMAAANRSAAELDAPRPFGDLMRLCEAMRFGRHPSDQMQAAWRAANVSWRSATPENSDIPGEPPR